MRFRPQQTRFVAALLPALTLTLTLAVAPPARAQEAKAPETEQTVPAGEPELSVTDHSITIDGRRLDYTVTTGYMPMKTEAGETRANMFFMAYTKDGVDDVSRRPITFVFNGGPGSSSVWLHLGTCGPKRVLMNDDGTAPPPPYTLVDNESTWLTHTDLVFIDPVGTGYSRPAGGAEQKEFSGYEEDIRSVGDFIRLYTTRSERWLSPKFIAGESYGTTRAAGLSGYLQNRHGMYLNGLILVSSILNFQTARFDPGNDLPYVLFLPTYTATAWYHDALPSDLQQRPLRAVLDEVEAFALDEYLPALAQGANIDAERERRVTRALARYTGLSEEEISQTNLRVHIMRFTKALLRDERRSVGRLDSRFQGIDRDAAGESFEHDPSMTAIMGPYTAALNDYVRTDLKFESDIPYEILTWRVRPWSYASFENRYVNVAETLREAISKNNDLRVFIASGYYDLATPFLATDYTVAHMQLEPELQGNIEVEHYESGHMMYIHEPSLRKLHEDVARFIELADNVEPQAARRGR